MSATSKSVISDSVPEKHRVRQENLKHASKSSLKDKNSEWLDHSSSGSRKLMENETNKVRMELLSSTMTGLLNDALTLQFYGNISIHVNIQDGVIQSIRSSLERAIR